MWRTIRRAVRITGGSVAAAGLCAGIAAGLLERLPHHTLASVWAGLLGLGFALFAIYRRWTFRGVPARWQRVSKILRWAADFAEIEFVLASVACLYTLFALSGQAASLFYPLLYAFVAFVVTVMAPAASVATCGAVCLIEAGALARDETPLALGVAHIIYVAGAAAAHAVLMRALAARVMWRGKALLTEREATARETAREFRLATIALGPASRAPRTRAEEVDLLEQGGLRLLSESTSYLLGSTQRMLQAQTVCLVWLDDQDALWVRDAASNADDVIIGKLNSPGLLAAVVRDRTPLLLGSTKPGQLIYYAARRSGLAFVAAPILENGHVRGLLCADRPAPFSDQDREFLVEAATQMRRTLDAERVFRAVERSKYEYERFYQATVLLSRALTPEQVMERAFDAAATITAFDAVVMALYDKEAGKHKVVAHRIAAGAATWVRAEDLADLEFRDNAGLVAMAVKNRHYLPATGEVRESSVPVFAKKPSFAEAKSLLVVPMIVADDAIGTMTLMASEEKRFSSDVREMLSVIANQTAIALQNGFLYRKMETMATTDGLTGLTNHRAFQERFADVLERAQRYGRPAAMLLCDVDHFKKVNDNFGHPVGDEVLRRVAAVLQDVARKIDITARYGGEEFAVVLDGADEQQAYVVGERIREQVGKLVIETDKGPLRVTQSIGVAAFPADGRDRAALIERADLALYHAKHSGRNRVMTYSQFVAQKERTKAAAPGESMVIRASARAN